MSDLYLPELRTTNQILSRLAGYHRTTKLYNAQQSFLYGRIKMLKFKCHCMADEIQHIEESISDLRRHLKELDNKKRALTDDLHRTQKDESSLQEEIKRMRRDIEERESKLSVLNNKSKGIESDIKRQEEKRREYDTNLKRLTQTLDQLRLRISRN